MLNLCINALGLITCERKYHKLDGEKYFEEKAFL
jgi:hypothetical protein